MWEYLNSFDEREVLIAHYIKKYIDGGNLFDLDCGYAPLSKHLTGFTYYGNDIIDTRPDIDHFYNISDSDIRHLLIPKLDVIVLMGIGGYEISGEKTESPTVRKTLTELVVTHKPKVVVQECIQEYSQLILDFPRYKTAHYTKIKPVCIPEMDRVFYRVISVKVSQD